MADTLDVVFDYAQQRLRYRSARIALLGAELFDDQFSGAGRLMLLPLANCLCLRPYQLDAAYDTSNAGNYAKYTIGSGYEVLTSGSWKAHEDFVGAGSFMCCDAPGAGEYIRTADSIGKNRGVVLTFHPYSAKDGRALIDFGYGGTTAETATVGFRLWTNGLLELFRNGEWVADLRGLQITANEFNRLVIMPCRRRELIIFTVGYDNKKDGVAASTTRYVFEDIEEGAASPEITPDAKFFVAPGAGGSGNLKVQFQPVTFSTVGTALSRTWTFGDPPREGATLSHSLLYYDPSYAGTDTAAVLDVRNTTNSAAFVPNGEDSQARVRIQFTSDGLYTSFAYGAMVQYTGQADYTLGATEFVANDWVTRLDLQVPDEPFGARAALEMLNRREYVETTGEGTEESPTVTSDETEDLEDRLENAYTMSWRPCKLELGSNVVLDGVVRRPKFIDSIYDETKRFACEVRSLYCMLEKFQFVTRMPFDGWELRDAVEFVVTETGLEVELVVSDFDYTIGQVPHESCEEWNVAAEVGDTALQVLEKLFRLVSDGFMGERPGYLYPEFHFRSKEDMDAEAPVLTLYRTIQDAIDAGAADEYAASLLLYDEWREETSEIEAGEVRAIGVDPRTGAILMSVARVDALVDPTQGPSGAPSGWCGFPLAAGLMSRTFRQQEDCDRAVEGLLPVATQQLVLGEFKANNLLLKPDGRPVWRGDKITLDGIGDRQIAGFSASFIKELADDGEFYRRASYTTGNPLGKGGLTIQDIQGHQEARSFEQFVADLRAAPLFATGVLTVSRN